MKRLLLLFLISVICAGCWDKQELNELAVIAGLAIDEHEDGIQVSVQIVNQSEISPQANASGVTPVTLRKATGKTLHEAINKLSLKNSRVLHFSHLRLLVLSEDIARKGIQDLLDFFIRDKNFRSDFYIIVARDSQAEDLLKVQTIGEKISANVLHKTLEDSNENWGQAVAVRLKDLINELNYPKNNPVLTGMKVQGDIEIGEKKENTESVEAAAIFQYVGLALFKKDKLVGWLDDEDGRAYNLLVDRIKKTSLQLKCPKEGEMSVEFTKSKTKRTPLIDHNGKPKIKIDIQNKAKIEEVACDFDLTLDKNVAKAEKMIEKQLRQYLEKTIHIAQKEIKSDIFGFGELFYRNHQKEWKKIEKDWAKIFQELAVEINVETEINHLGTIGKSTTVDEGA